MRKWADASGRGNASLDRRSPAQTIQHIYARAQTLLDHFRIAYLSRPNGDIHILGVFHGALDISRYTLKMCIVPYAHTLPVRTLEASNSFERNHLWMIGWRTGGEGPTAYMEVAMSPTVFRDGPFRFYFFSREEPRIHIHVNCADGEAKFWLAPDIELAQNFGLTERQLRAAQALVEEHANEIHSAWEKHFGR